LGSPFKCDAFDASKVKLEKIKLTNFVVNKKINFSRELIKSNFEAFAIFKFE
jgi:hypothetical protein